LADVSQSRLWSSGYEAFAESAIADTSQNVVVALLSARWSHIKDIKNISWFATCKPQLVSGAGTPLNSALIMHKIISHLESHITKENAGNYFPVLQLVAAAAMLDEILDGTATDIVSVMLTLLSYGVMVILCGVSDKATLDKVIDRTILRYETVSLSPLSVPYLAEIMTTAALTLGRRFSRGFVDHFCDQLFSLFGCHARAATTVIAHALQTSTKERALSLEDAIICNAAKEVYSENDIEKHFASFGARGPKLIEKALPLIIFNAVLNTAVDGACRLPFDYSLTDILLGFPTPYTLSRMGNEQLIHFYPAAVSLPTLTRFAFERVQHDMLLSFDAVSLTQRLKLSQETEGTSRGTYFEDLFQSAMFLRLCLHRASSPEHSSVRTEQIIPFTSTLGIGGEPWILRPQIVHGESLQAASTLSNPANQGAIIRGIPEHAAFDLAIPQPTINYLFYVKALNPGNNHLTFAELRKEVNKAPSTSTDSTPLRVMIILASPYCKPVQDSFEGADLLQITSGRYALTAPPCRISCGVATTKVTLCNQSSLVGTAAGTEIIRVTKLGPLHASNTAASPHNLVIPINTMLVLLNPRTTTTVFRQLFVVDAISVLGNVTAPSGELTRRHACGWHACS
jgi:hypothetical protein